MSTYQSDHANDPKIWKLHDGTEVSTAGLKQMFFGKVPGKQVRRLLNIEKIGK